MAEKKGGRSSIPRPPSLTAENGPEFRCDQSAVGLPDGPWADEESPASAAMTDSFFAGLVADALPDE
jgi:hypothetical protein